MRLPLRALGLLAWVVSSSGCGGSSYEGQVYRGEQLSFRTGAVPAQWRSVEVDGALLAFRDDQAGATVAVNGRCGVDGDDVPLDALTKHLFLVFTDRKLTNQRTVELDGRDALRTELTAELDGVSKQFLVFVLKKDGCVYDFMWIASVDATPASRAAFERFVSGFSTHI
jgi:hypothetical protein